MRLREVRTRARKLQKTLHLEDWSINVRWATAKDLKEFKQNQKRFKVYREYPDVDGGVLVTNPLKKRAAVFVVRRKREDELDEIDTILVHEFIHLHLFGLRISQKQNERVTTILEDVICASLFGYDFARRTLLDYVDYHKSLVQHHKKCHKGCKFGKKTQ